MLKVTFGVTLFGKYSYLAQVITSYFDYIPNKLLN